MDTANAAAHAVIFSIATFCFVLGDVGTSLALAFLPGFLRAEAPAARTPLDRGAELDVARARPTIANVLKVSWSISAVCVALSTGIASKGARAFTSQASVVAAIRRCLSLMALTFASHASAVTLEGVLLVERDLGFLCAFYACLGASIWRLHAAIAARKLGLPSLWAVYVYFQVVRAAAFAWRAGLIRKRRARG